MNQRRITLIQERASYSQYLLLPTKFNFRKTVRIYTYIFTFISKLRSAVSGRNNVAPKFLELEKYPLNFSIFTVEIVMPMGSYTSSSTQTNLYHDSPRLDCHYFAEFSDKVSPPGLFALTQSVNKADGLHLTDRYTNLALTYLYQKASSEVKKFNSKKIVDKLCVEQNGILFSKNRIIGGMSFAELGGLEVSDLSVMGIKSHVPVIDRHSPLAFSISQHVHWNIAHHKGIESCNRYSLQYCCILQGMSLYKEISEDCLWCIKKKKKMVEVSMGPISDHQLSIAPPFWCSQIDLFGPILCSVAGFERKTRNKNPAQIKT